MHMAHAHAPKIVCGNAESACPIELSRRSRRIKNDTHGACRNFLAPSAFLIFPGSVFRDRMWGKPQNTSFSRGISGNLISRGFAAPFNDQSTR
jgi:hypothetical protein